LISHDRDFLDRLVSGVIVPEGDGVWTEYAGGYSDMLTQRGADLTRERRDAGQPSAAKETSAPAAAQTAKRRMTFKDKHALETLPANIAKWQTEVATLQTKLAGMKEEIFTHLTPIQRVQLARHPRRRALAVPGGEEEVIA